jgi:transcriptional regulator with XRE-family HTH domain
MKAAALVAWNLRRLRVRRGLSQEGLAAEAEVDRSYVGRLERAQENPTSGLLERIAAVLDAKMIEFFREPLKSEQPPRPLPGGRRRKM